ncbi:hypothetical protein CSA80_02555 [Candidatus Saccharibacteria bacterium]|nr:MAG: hypothetical protein CSA80_02555 [Candidatus Saccharibacteria bacterium]
MANHNTPNPYRSLGAKLRKLREQHRESVGEVSGAVEIDEVQLQSIEAGKARPSEDILMLLISHFGLDDDAAADELWKLAGYELHRDSEHDHDHKHDEGDMKRAAAMMVMLDPRVMYSDNVEIVSNKQGVVISFSQTVGPDAEPLTVSRIGMSYEEAKVVMGILHQVLYNHENPSKRRLGGGTSTAGDK